MERKMYTFKVRINNSDPLYKTIVVHSTSDRDAEMLAMAKINKEWSSVYSIGRDSVQLEVVGVV